MTDIPYSTALIVGAGPTGLTLAIDLARRGISFRLIESAATPFEGSRGKGIQPRTLEVFDDLGVIDAILAAGALYPKFRTHIGRFSLRAGSLESFKQPTESVPYPNIWMVPPSVWWSALSDIARLDFGSDDSSRRNLLHGVTGLTRIRCMCVFKGVNFYVYHGEEGSEGSSTGLRMLNPGLLQTCV